MNRAYFHSLALVLVSGLATAVAMPAKAEVTVAKQAKYPTYTADYYDNAGKLDSNRYGKLSAIKGTIIKIDAGPKARPLLQLQLAQPAKTVWVASLYEAPKDHFSIQQEVKVLGFFDKTKLIPKYMAQRTTQPEYLLGFCFYTNEKQIPLYLTKYLKKCLEWEKAADPAIKPIETKEPQPAKPAQPVKK